MYVDSVALPEIQTLDADRHLKCGSLICVERANHALPCRGSDGDEREHYLLFAARGETNSSRPLFFLLLRPRPPLLSHSVSPLLFPPPPPPPPARSVAVRAAAVTPRTDPSQRIVVTGMGIASCFGNDVNTFYDKLLAGTSAVGAIDRFDASEFPTNFAAQIRNFDNEG